MNKAELTEEYEKGYEELISILDILHKDLAICEKRLSKGGNQFWRRAYARAIFAYVEAMTYRKKIQAIRAYRLGKVEYSQAEIAIMLEETYELDDKGEAKAKRVFSNITKNLRFAFEVYARTYRIKFKLDCGDDRWESFRKAIKIRDRVTHPKELIDLNISDWRSANPERSERLVYGERSCFTICYQSATPQRG